MRCCSMKKMLFHFLITLVGIASALLPVVQKSNLTDFSSPVKIALYVTDLRDDKFLETALRFALQKINEAGVHLDYSMDYSVSYISPLHLLESYKTFCQQVSDGVSVHVMPKDDETARFFLFACDRLDLVCVDIFQRETAEEFQTALSVQSNSLIIGRAVVDLLNFFYHNKTVAIVDGPEDVSRLDSIVMHAQSSRIFTGIFFKNGTDYRQILRRLRSEDVVTFIVAVKDINFSQFVQNVFQLNMHDDKFTYIFLGLNALVEDMTDISFLGSNILAFSIIDPANQVAAAKIGDLVTFAQKRGILTRNAPKITNFIPADAAILMDAISLISEALKKILPLPRDFSQPITCHSNSRWAYGSSLINYLNTIGTEGITGTIKIESNSRTEGSLHLMKLTENGFKKIGRWASPSGLALDESITTPKAFSSKKYKASTGTDDDPLIVVSILQEPFLMLKDSYRKELALTKTEPVLSHITNEHVQGFVIDLLDAISQNMIIRGYKGFKYKLYLVPDGQFGIQDEVTGNWSGLMKELLDGKANLAVAPFTLTASREEYISFTKPFMTAGIGILYQAPRGSAPNLFALMRSLSPELWLGSLGSSVVIGCSLWLIARFSPLEWESRHFCTGEPTRFAVNSFNLRNSLWFSVCSLMMQGCDLNPRAVSTRLLGGTWWFYTLFLSAHFIAKLASVLTVEKMSVPFSNIDELIKHPDITYGILHNGSTYEFFRDSKISVYKEMFEYMEARPSMFTKSYQEGVQKVMNEKYAFLMESTEIEYLIERNCNVTQIGGTLNTIQYGIGTPKGSPWTERLSMAILHLIENSAIAELQEQWWKRGGVCTKEEKSSGPSAINIALCGGAFLILAIGLVIAVIVAITEFIWNAVYNAHVEKALIWSEFMLELRDALHFRASSTRPVLQKVCRTCGVEIRSLSAAQAHEHRDYTPMRFLDNLELVDLQRRRALY